ncbi:hypothetical protein PG994_010894 [Apiospora phragmitis]|uniref:Uncharacterized protein n=1 Tax=Apiospora phragmitis TaxID=2905665 RepID=A0ABR1TRD6_9PEZI
MVAPLGGIWAPTALRLARQAVYKASKVIRAKLANTARPLNTALEPVLARSTPRQPIHPAALLRQQKSRRWNSTSTYQNINSAVRRFMSTGRLSEAPRVDRTKFNTTQVGRAVSQFTGRAPFASTLRPNLTGGVLPRTAGGYGLGSGRIGGARYFSHTPAAQAQVVNNVSAAVRAFWISGQKAQFDGLTERGERRYRAVSSLQDETARKMTHGLEPPCWSIPYAAAGTKVPAADAATLNAEGFFDVLSVDFGRALKDLTATLGDLKKLAALGDLPIQLEKGHIIRVRFPGVDADTVETLCDDLEISRGIVGQDVGFEAEAGVTMALKFPFAPGANEQHSLTLTSAGGSLLSLGSFPDEYELFEAFSEVEKNSWLASSEPEGYESMSRRSVRVSTVRRISRACKAFIGSWRNAIGPREGFDIQTWAIV